MHTKFETEDEVHIVMEYCAGGSLASHLSKFSQKGGRMTEQKMWTLFAQVAAGLAYMHQRNICHRDIKMENCVVNLPGHKGGLGQGGGEVVKLVDFGLGARTDANACSTICGSPEYMAPELVSAIDSQGRASRIKYDGKPVDVWSLGVLLYVLATGGSFPFSAYNNNLQTLYANIKRGVFQCRSSQITPACQGLLRRMLCVDPDNRITIDQVEEKVKSIMRKQSSS
jgi:serine/threonine protein kinase